MNFEILSRTRCATSPRRRPNDPARATARPVSSACWTPSRSRPRSCCATACRSTSSLAAPAITRCRRTRPAASPRLPVDYRCTRRRACRSSGTVSTTGCRSSCSRTDALPLVAVNLWYHVGSRDEQPGRTGLAHLFEHMLFQGSRQRRHKRALPLRPAGRRRRQRLHLAGPHQLLRDDAVTPSRSGPVARVGSHGVPPAGPGSGEARPPARRGAQRAPPDRRQPALRARRRTALRALLPATPPLPLAGPRAIRRISEATTLEDVESFFRRFYAPDNAVLTLAGDFEPRQALASIERYFGDLPRGPGVAAPSPPTLPIPPGELRETMADDVELTRIYHAWTLPAYGRRTWYAADLLASVLAQGKSSPLYRELVYERQLAQDVGIYVQPTELASMFLVVATARPDVDPDLLERALDDQIAAAAAQPPDDHELERARNHVRVGLPRAAAEPGSAGRPALATDHLLRRAGTPRPRAGPLSGDRRRRDPGGGRRAPAA